ncbi:hypothetical protein J7T55_005304 [Diaporthe amygdali]|uniref:uncharacterized protein n=1 Tax=Phomopsis amygdali TaxID=1214568 RepID=UPI0022FDBF18|nr:uncharacterized protein J7T55_005304 [Diaporthe amygdali]KAJ0108327.1 hypothetical protein J7T55_005304 [Diaporthe amygdali]
MKLSVFALAAFTGLAACQCISAIPECAQQCLLIGASSVGCGETDYSCQCTSQHQTDITNNATTCVLAACGEQTALNEVLPAAQAFCSAINAGESCSSSSGGGSSTTASSTESTGTAAPSTGSSGSASSPSATLSTTISVTSSGTEASGTTGGSSTATGASTTAASSGSGTATGASASASSTAGAATVGSIGSLGIAVLGALVML